MDRRTALRNISLGTGYLVSSGTILGILNSCKEAPETWQPSYLTKEEGKMITLLSDLILPASETPGALDVNVPQFIDKMYKDIETEENQTLFKRGANLFSEEFKMEYGKDIMKAEPAEVEKLLSKYFNLSEKEESKVKSLMSKAITEVAPADLDSYEMYKFLMAVRYYTLFGYFTSEKVGEEILSYDPVPGVYQGCIPASEVGNAWSL